jgi:hypothetical protein
MVLGCFESLASVYDITSNVLLGVEKDLIRRKGYNQ